MPWGDVCVDVYIHTGGEDGVDGVDLGGSHDEAETSAGRKGGREGERGRSVGVASGVGYICSCRGCAYLCSWRYTSREQSCVAVDSSTYLGTWRLQYAMGL